MPWKYLRMTRRCTRDRLTVRKEQIQTRRHIFAAAYFLRKKPSENSDGLILCFNILHLGILSEESQMVLQKRNT